MILFIQVSGSYWHNVSAQYLSRGFPTISGNWYHVELLHFVGLEGVLHDTIHWLLACQSKSYIKFAQTKFISKFCFTFDMKYHQNEFVKFLFNRFLSHFNFLSLPFPMFLSPLILGICLHSWKWWMYRTMKSLG